MLPLCHAVDVQVLRGGYQRMADDRGVEREDASKVSGQRCYEAGAEVWT